ncbi:MAG TPA: phospholipase D-like domain-containing protein [Kofleriaceae bacterium]|nr:phospholipase D-like domain-containing protein [Kofleriaceae bacterium]
MSIIVEPDGMKGAELVSAINAAHTSVYMTMYQIDDTDVIDALVARAKAGLDVQAVLDGSSTCKSWNTSAYNTFNSNGVKAVWSSPSFTYTHEKTVIIDGTTAWIMTMNANTSSPEYNREYLAIDTDASDVAEATAIFKADHAMQSITPSGALVVADTNARQKLVQLINSATKTLDVEVEEFSDTNSNGIVDAVTAAANRGVTVRVVIANDTLDANGMQAINMVKNAGGKVVMTGPTSDAGTASNPYIHAKAIIVDCVSGTCASGFVGSENFSAGSVGYNRELGVIFDEADQLAKVESSITSDFSRGTAQ